MASPAGTSPILIVEDHDDSRELLQQVLEKAGYRTTGCGSGLEALTALQSGERPCLFLLDLNMPDVNGLGFRAEQQRHEDVKDIPILVMSGVAEPRDYHANLKAIGYLRKPFDVTEVLAFVQKACGVPQ